MKPGKISTPCIGRFGIDEENDLCRGCRRSRAEIVAWLGMDEAERRALVRLLPFRGSVKTVADLNEHVLHLGADADKDADRAG
jgi:predicted Fe-S protein YdhL (DUF1289 family)